MKTKDLLLFGVLGFGAYYFISQQRDASYTRELEQRAGGGTQTGTPNGASGGDLAGSIASIFSSIFKMAETKYTANSYTL